MEILHRFGLLAVFVALQPPFSSAVPEEVSLMFAGFLAGTSRAALWLSLLVAWAGLVCADSLTWTVGRAVGLHPEGRMARLIGHHRIERIERFYRRWGPWTIVICRQIPGLRLPTFFFAGAVRFPLPRFLAFDAFAAVFTTSVYVGLGYLFADEFERLLARMEQAREILLYGAGALIAVGVAVALWRRRQAVA